MRTAYSQPVFERLDKRIAQSLRGNLDVVLRLVVGGVAVPPGIVIVPAHVTVVVLRGNVCPGRHYVGDSRRVLALARVEAEVDSPVFVLNRQAIQIFPSGRDSCRCPAPSTLAAKRPMRLPGTSSD